MKYIYFMVLSMILFCCSTGSPTSYPSDFSVKYYMKNGLMKTDLTVEINGDKLKVRYENGQKNIKKNTDYNISEKEISEIYKYMKSTGFSTMLSPESEKIVDAPIQNITGIYDNKTNMINFGSVKSPPENITKLKKMLLELADKYDKSWRIDTDMQ